MVALPPNFPSLEDQSLYVLTSEQKNQIAQDPSESSTSLLRQGMVTLIEFIYETPASGIGFAVAAIASRYIYPPLAPPFWGLTLGMVSGRIFIRILEACHCKQTIAIKRGAIKLVRRFPKLQLIGAIFALVLGVIWAPLGVLAGLGIGVIGGVNVSVEQALRRQRLHAERQRREAQEAPYRLTLQPV